MADTVGWWLLMVRGRERKEQRTGDSGLEPPACDAVTTDSHHCARGAEQRPALMSPVESEH